MDAGARDQHRHRQHGTADVGTDRDSATDATADPDARPMSLDKTADTVDATTSVGDTIAYSYHVTNTGNVTLTGPVDRHRRPGRRRRLPGHDAGPGCLDDLHGHLHDHPGRLDAGAVDNTATATRPTRPRLGTDRPRPSPPTQTPGADRWTRRPTPGTYDAVGDVDRLHLLVTNTGNVTLTACRSRRHRRRAAVTCPADAAWPPAATVDLHGDLHRHPGRLDAGSCRPTPRPSPARPDGVDVTATDTATSTAVQSPAITLDKTADARRPTARSATYRLQLPRHQHRQRHADRRSPSPTTRSTRRPARCATLAPRRLDDLHGDYTITQADLDAGSVDNTATRQRTPHGIDVDRGHATTVTADPEPGAHARQERRRRRPTTRRRRHRLQLPGDQHRQRHPDRPGHRRPTTRSASCLPGTRPWRRAPRDLHRDLHAHPGRLDAGT